MRPPARIALALLGITSGVPAPVPAAEPTPVELEGVGVTERLGERIPLDLRFTDPRGRAVTLGDYFRADRPVVLVLGYYECPMLCSMVLNAFTTAARDLAWTAGNEFNVVTVSIDPGETPGLAAAKRVEYLGRYGREVPDAGWEFLVGAEDPVKALAAAVGFNYRYDARQDQYAHASVIFVATPDGRVSRNLYGISYEASDLKLALLEASEGRIGTFVDRLWLYCYHYDPVGRKYQLMAMRVMRLGGAVTVVLLAGFIALMWRRERRAAARRAPDPPSPSSSSPGGPLPAPGAGGASDG